jgi:hypothetical protein
MGWLGTALAVEFDRRGVDFTWHDVDRQIAAWPASTGCVYPAGDWRSSEDLWTWCDWIEERRFEGRAAYARWWYTQKAPPHGGPRAELDLGFARRSPAYAVTVDVAGCVLDARARFADLRRDAPPPGVRRVVAHGWSRRFHRAGWGWAQRVKIEHPFPPGARPAVLARLDRFRAGYLYPVPGTDEWWAGSSTTVQRDPRRLDPAGRIEAWSDLMAHLCPWLHIEPVADPVQGWRPRGLTLDPSIEVDPDGTIIVPPLSHSGVRWAPGVVAEVMEVVS